MARAHIAILSPHRDAYAELMAKSVARSVSQPVPQLGTLPASAIPDSQPLTWGQIEQLQGLNIPCIRHVPRSCCSMFIALCRDLLTAPTFQAESPSAAALLPVLPKLVFPSLSCSEAGKPAPPKARQKTCMQRLQHARNGLQLVVSGSTSLS